MTKRRTEDVLAAGVTAFVWVSMFAASHTWEFAVAGTITLVCIGLLLRKR